MKMFKKKVLTAFLVLAMTVLLIPTVSFAKNVTFELGTPTGKEEYQFKSAVVDEVFDITSITFSVDSGEVNITNSPTQEYRVIYDLNKRTALVLFQSPTDSVHIQSLIRNSVTFKAQLGTTQNISITLDGNETVLPADAPITVAEVDGKMHAYMYVNEQVSWSDAYKSAKSFSYRGLTGYLVTITSAIEDTILDNITLQGGWSGGSRYWADTGEYDQATASNYKDPTKNNLFRWMCGPEAGQAYYKYENPDHDSGGNGAIEGMYQNFIDPAEPNNFDVANNTRNGYDFGPYEWCMQVHFPFRGGTSWNDLEDAVLKEAKGYFVEFSEYGNNVIDPLKVDIVTQAVKIENRFELTLDTTLLTGAKASASKITNIGESESVTITVVPEVGYEFGSAPAILVEGAIAGNATPNLDGSLTYILSGFSKDATAQIIGAATELTYSIQVGADGNGTATSSVTSASKGDKVILSANPYKGYEFKMWNVIKGGVKIANDSFVMGSEPVEIKAIFGKILYSLKLDDSRLYGAMALPSKTSGIVFDDQVVITITPEDGKEFATPPSVSAIKATVGNVVAHANGTYTCTLSNFDGNETVEVVGSTVNKSYAITISNDGNGTATADMASATKGTVVTLSATPNKEYKLKGWEVISGGVIVTNDQFVIGDEPVKIKAIFERITYQLTLDINNLSDANVTVGQKTGILAEDNVMITIVPEKGKKFVSAPTLSVTNAVAGQIIANEDGSYTCTLTNFSGIANVVISGKAETETFAITVNGNEQGEASADLVKASKGTKVTLTATPKEGYIFKEWQVVSGDITITDNQFVMGDKPVEIKAVFEKEAPAVTPSTGDATNTTLFGGMMMLSLVAIIGGMIYKKREENHSES